MITGVTDIAHINTKQDMSRWTRAHADRPGINWSVFAGPGGTMIIVEHAEDRCSRGRLAAATADASGQAGVSADVIASADVMAGADTRADIIPSTDIVSLSA